VVAGKSVALYIAPLLYGLFQRHHLCGNHSQISWLLFRRNGWHSYIQAAHFYMHSHCCSCQSWHIFTCCCSAQAHWTATVHFAFLAATGAFILSLLPFLYFGFHTYWHWYHTDSKDSLQPSAATGVNEPSQEASEAQSGDPHLHVLLYPIECVS